MTNTDLFIVRAKSKRGRIIYFLANFDSLIEHKHLNTVQYFDDITKKWINFSDIENGTILGKNVENKKISLKKLGGSIGNIYYGFEVKYTIYNKNKKEICSKISSGNPTEWIAYLRRFLERSGYNPDELFYTATIIDQVDWYESRKRNEKRKGEGSTNFTIVHY